MARAREWLHNQVLVGLGLPANTVGADLPTGDGTLPNPLTTEEQIDRVLDEARFLVTRHLRLIPGRASKQSVTGQMYYALADFDAIQAQDGTSVPPGGDGSRLWALYTLVHGTKPLVYSRRSSLRLYKPSYEADTNAVPDYWFPTDETGENIGIYPRPPLGQTLAASGYVIPPPLTFGAQQWDFLADEEFAPLISYACFKIGEQAGPGLDNAIAAKLGLWASDWNNAAVAWFARLSDQDKRDYRMVLPLVGNVGASGADGG